ncbi:MAG: hypothetical protein IJJ63_01675 [Bacilli bacterium]|nr:hypothetical protein [Bacilli bacterium]
MHRKKANYYAKILIAVSITFILYGCFLEFGSISKVFDPVKEVIPIDNQEESIVSITPVDGSEVVTDSTTSSQDENNIPQPSVDLNTLISEKNDSLRKEIENQFQVKIYYGKETANYTVAGIGTTEITDETVVYNQLMRLKNTLGLYPSGLFLEIKNGGIPLSIYLINSYSENSITGITDSNYNYAKISIAAIYPFEESFYHESYHYIERYMFREGASFKSWDSLNPEGFSYGSIYNRYSYANTFLAESPFVNNYAQSSDAEDRASTFEYMMAASKASCLNNGNTVWQKATYMARTLEASLDSVSPDVVEYWERFL